MKDCPFSPSLDDVCCLVCDCKSDAKTPEEVQAAWRRIRVLKDNEITISKDVLISIYGKRLHLTIEEAAGIAQAIRKANYGYSSWLASLRLDGYAWGAQENICKEKHQPRWMIISTLHQIPEYRPGSMLVECWADSEESALQIAHQIFDATEAHHPFKKYAWKPRGRSPWVEVTCQ